MDFFKSILSDDPDPAVPENPQVLEPNYPTNPHQEEEDVIDSDQSSPPNDEVPSSKPNPNPNLSGGGGGWSFGGLMKTFASRSESVLGTYRRDLEEFGSGLKKETALFREVASRAVKELPASIEVSASKAQGSLETFGHAIDGVLKSTADIISHGKDTLLAPSDVEFDSSDTRNNSNRSVDSRRYSRFDAQLRAIQSDVNTFCEEPEDLDDYDKWKLGFVFEEKSDEVDNLIEDNGAMEGIYERVVPNEVDHYTFWCRYFYRVHKLKQQENVRANLVKRAISIDDEEELSWDVDDDEEETNVPLQGNANAPDNKELGNKDVPQIVEESSKNENSIEGSHGVDEDGEKKTNLVSVNEGNVVELSGDNLSNENARSEWTSEVSENELVSKSDEKVALDGKADNGESCKDSDVSVVSTQPSLPEEEDLEWDEIEDLGSNDEKKVSHDGSLTRADERKPLITTEEEEDLSWDIEDDDEPLKA